MGISAKQFRKLQARVCDKKGISKTDITPDHSILLGVDPSLRGTGYGIIKLGKSTPHTLAQGTIKCPSKWERSRCLAEIASTIRKVVKKHQPTLCAVEGLFYAQNMKTALTMGEARGAALAVIAEAGLEIFEIAPRKVKQAITGHGNAQKLAVAKMVQQMLALKDLPEPDAADALAIALAHAQTHNRFIFEAHKKI